MNPLPVWRRYWLTAKEAALLLNVPGAAEVFALVVAGDVPRVAVARIAARAYLHFPTLHHLALLWGIA